MARHCGASDRATSPSLRRGRQALAMRARVGRGRRGREAEGGGLLNRYRVVKLYHGFESHRLRQNIFMNHQIGSSGGLVVHKPELIFDARDIVGESLVYDDRRDALIWVDIGGRRIHRLWLADRRHEAWNTPDFPTSIGLDRNGDAVVGFTDRVARWVFGGKFETLAIVEPDL